MPGLDDPKKLLDVIGKTASLTFRMVDSSMSAEQALAWGFTGPCLRASGVPWDLRKAQPYEMYDQVDFKIAVGRNGERHMARRLGTIKNHDVAANGHPVPILEWARRHDAQLPMAEHAFEGERDVRVRRSPVLHGNGVAGAGDVRILPEGREDGTADDQIADRTGEGGEPMQRPLPYDAIGTEFDPGAIAFEHRTGERRPGAGQKGRAAGELHRRTGTAMQHTDRVKRGVRGVHARERQPVVAGDLPGNGLQGVVCHGNGLCVILPYVYAN